MVRILFITAGSEGVGTYFRMFHIGRHLVKRGHDVLMVLANREPTIKPFARKSVEGMRVVNLLKTPFQWDYPGYIMRSFYAPFFVFDSYDIIHVFGVPVPPSAGVILLQKLLKTLRVSRAPLILDWDDWWGEGGLAKYHKPIIYKGISFFEEKMPLLADGVVVVGDKLRERALEVGVKADKLFEIPNGANVDSIHPLCKLDACCKLSLNGNNHILGYVGHFHTSAFSMMLSAFNRVVKERSDVSLLIVGAVDLEREKVIQENKQLKDHIIAVGRQSYDRVQLYLGAADILLMPMEKSIIEEARFPMRFGDYLASGRPMVASAVGEVKNAVEKEDCGILASPDDPKDFADKIALLLDNKKLCEELGRKARRTAEEIYSWQNLTCDLEQVYRKLKKVQ